MMPNDLPPWHTVSQQSRRWLKAKVFEAMVHGLRELLRVAGGRNAQPSAAVLDGRTLQSTPEAARAPATMATSVKTAARFTWPWTRWACCSTCW